MSLERRQRRYLLQQLVVLHVLLGGGAGALGLLLEGFVGGHERGLLGQQRGQATQQPASDETSPQNTINEGSGITAACKQHCRSTKEPR